MDDKLKDLQTKLKKSATFLNDIPSNLQEMLDDYSVVVLDDVELMLERSREKKDLIMRLAFVNCAHGNTICFLLLQSFQIFLRRSPLNPLVAQTTALVLFRSINTLGSLQRILNSYSAVQLKKGTTLYDIFKSYVQKENYNYIIISLSPALAKPEVYAQVLLSDSRPLLIFHEE